LQPERKVVASYRPLAINISHSESLDWARHLREQGVSAGPAANFIAHGIGKA
jgi:hypothetical protein